MDGRVFVASPGQVSLDRPTNWFGWWPGMIPLGNTLPPGSSVVVPYTLRRLLSVLTGWRRPRPTRSTPTAPLSSGTRWAATLGKRTLHFAVCRRPSLGAPGRGSPMSHVVLKLSDPKVVQVLADMSVLERWEVLRRLGDPMSAAECAAACGAPLSDTQASLDLLVDAGFVVRLKASSRRRHVTYRSASDSVVVEFNSRCSAERSLADKFMHGFVVWAREVMDDARASCEIRTKSLRHLRGVLTPVLTYEESVEALDIVSDAMRRLAVLDQRAFDRARSDPSRAADGRTRGYLMELILQPLHKPQRPRPQLMILGSDGIKRMLKRHSESPSKLLGPKEQEIARRLAAGESRPSIARALKISVHTVTATSRRIYAKLGIHSRAELAARML